MQTTTQTLTIEKSTDGTLWGRVEFQDDLLVDSAKNIGTLEKKFKKLLRDFHEVDPASVTFEIAYDLTAVFDKNEFLNISAVAERAGVNTSLMRQYATGNKYPSPDKVKHIEKALHALGKELLQIKLSTKRKHSSKAV